MNTAKVKKATKRNSKEIHNLTVTNRTLINANWQKLIAGNYIMDKKVDKPTEENDKPHYTGTFRRSRKKKNMSLQTSGLQNNLENLKVRENKVEDHDKNISEHNSENDISKSNNNIDDKKDKLTKFIAMDCEMVGIGFEGRDNMLARISLVNKFGDCIYDKFVKPREEVIDYRTSVSGVRKEDLLNGTDFVVVQKEVKIINMST